MLVSPSFLSHDYRDLLDPIVPEFYDSVHSAQLTLKIYVLKESKFSLLGALILAQLNSFFFLHTQHITPKFHHHTISISYEFSYIVTDIFLLQFCFYRLKSVFPSD